MGQNDYNVAGFDPDTKIPILEPGLGKDQPTDEQMNGIRSASVARLAKLKEELAVQGAEVTERERAVVAQEEAVIAKEREAETRAADVARREAAIATREAAIAEREAKLKAPKP